LELGHLLFLAVDVALLLDLPVLRVLFLEAKDLADALGAEVGASDEPLVSLKDGFGVKGFAVWAWRLFPGVGR
jgi:hypothetical protein